MKLLIFEWNWADEFDVHGFIIINESDYDGFVKCVGAFEDELTISFGTNEEFDFGSGAEIVESFTVKDITDEQAAQLVNVFGLRLHTFTNDKYKGKYYEFGWTPFVQALDMTL